MKECLLRAVSAALAALICLAAPTPAASEAPVTLFVFDRPPYYQLKDGQPAGGFLLILAQTVFEQAGVPYTVREMPPARILTTFATENVDACAVGWLETPERERFARFSHPIYHNEIPGLVLDEARAAGVTSPANLPRLLQSGWKWGLRVGFSYGPVIDAAFAAAPTAHITRFSDPMVMLRLLHKGRLDAILLKPEELAWLLGQEPQLAPYVRFVPVRGAARRIARHIMCDETVSPQIMARLDAAIDELVGPEADRIRLAIAERH
jgi:polar amino acid transport system substrate-binding protein